MRLLKVFSKGRRLHRSFMETKFHDEKFGMLVTVLARIRKLSPTLSHQLKITKIAIVKLHMKLRSVSKNIGGINSLICHQHLKLVTDIHTSPTSVTKIDLAYYNRLFGIKTILISRFPVLINCLWFYHTCKKQVFLNPFSKLFIWYSIGNHTSFIADTQAIRFDTLTWEYPDPRLFSQCKSLYKE